MNAPRLPLQRPSRVAHGAYTDARMVAWSRYDQALRMAGGDCAAEAAAAAELDAQLAAANRDFDRAMEAA